MHTKWRVSRGTDEQMKRFLFGLNEIISLDLLKTFDPQEMEVRPGPAARVRGRACEEARLIQWRGRTDGGTQTHST